MERERKLWSALNHPNIVPFYGHATNQDIFGTLGALISPVTRYLILYFYLTLLQWYEDGDAARFLARHGKEMDISARSRMVNISVSPSYRHSLFPKWMGVIAGVHYLHTYSPVIVHGDLKPVSRFNASRIDVDCSLSSEGKHSHRRTAEPQALRFRDISRADSRRNEWPHDHVCTYRY
jgi:serine/threonine protein kinase